MSVFKRTDNIIITHHKSAETGIFFPDEQWLPFVTVFAVKLYKDVFTAIIKHVCLRVSPPVFSYLVSFIFAAKGSLLRCCCTLLPRDQLVLSLLMGFVDDKKLIQNIASFQYPSKFWQFNGKECDQWNLIFLRSIWTSWIEHQALISVCRYQLWFTLFTQSSLVLSPPSLTLPLWLYHFPLFSLFWATLAQVLVFSEFLVSLLVWMLSHFFPCSLSHQREMGRGKELRAFVYERVRGGFIVKVET